MVPEQSTVAWVSSSSRWASSPWPLRSFLDQRANRHRDGAQSPAPWRSLPERDHLRCSPASPASSGRRHAAGIAFPSAAFLARDHRWIVSHRLALPHQDHGLNARTKSAPLSSGPRPGCSRLGRRAGAGPTGRGVTARDVVQTTPGVGHGAPRTPSTSATSLGRPGCRRCWRVLPGARTSGPTRHGCCHRSATSRCISRRCSGIRSRWSSTGADPNGWRSCWTWPGSSCGRGSCASPPRGSGRHRHTCWRGSRRGSTGERRTVSRPTVAAARPAVVSAGDRLAELLTAG